MLFRSKNLLNSLVCNTYEIQPERRDRRFWKKRDGFAWIWKKWKMKPLRKCFIFWSGRWESNPRPKLGKLLYCHCTTPAHFHTDSLIHDLTTFNRRQDAELNLQSVAGMSARDSVDDRVGRRSSCAVFTRQHQAFKSGVHTCMAAAARLAHA